MERFMYFELIWILHRSTEMLQFKYCTKGESYSMYYCETPLKPWTSGILLFWKAKATQGREN